VAWRLRDRLTPGDRAYLLAMVGPRYPGPSGLLERREVLERLVRLSPENADAWNMYAYAMCLDRRGTTMTPARCRAASRRAATLDSTSVMVQGMVNEFAMISGDTAIVRRSLGLLLRLDSLSARSRFIQWRTATVLGDSVTAHRLALSDSMVSTAADWNVGTIWGMAAFYLWDGRGLGDLEAALARSQAIAPTESQRMSLAGMRYGLAVARGRADSLTPPYRADWYAVFNAVFAGGDPSLAEAAAAALERQLGSPVTNGCCLERFAVAEWALEHGRLATARRALADMRRYPESPEGRAAGLRGPGVWAMIVAAQLAAREGSPSAGEHLRQLDSALVDAPDEPGDAWGYGNLISARLHERRGEYAAALAAIRAQPDAGVEPVGVALHRDGGRIAALAGDTAGAIREYERYLRIRGEAEPRLQPQVDSVRAALAELKRSRASTDRWSAVAGRR
jgi:hypothetical protein